MTSRILLFLLSAVCLLLPSACSEEDDTVEEYPDWINTNDVYYNRLSDSVKAIIAADPAQTAWKRVKVWSKPADIIGANNEYVIMHTIDQDPTQTGRPLYTDSCRVSYKGRLLPSRSYPQGLIFDATYSGTYDKDVAGRTNFAIGNATGTNLIDGFATALQNMHRGERCIVYIPYQLGYGTTTQGNIPGGSTLIFDIVLHNFWN